MSNDVGLQAIDKLFDKLQIDAAWSIRRPRGFTWWSYKLAQHIDASEPWQDDEFQLSRIRIVTDLVTSVDPGCQPEMLAGMANMQQILSAVVWDDTDLTMREYCTGIVHQENVGSLTQLLATAAITQNVAAHSRAQRLAQAAGGTPAASAHPITGERNEPDEMMGVPEHVIFPAGKDHSAFAGPLCASLKDFLPQYQLMGFSDAEGFSCEVPFTGSTPVVAKVALGRPTAKDRPETSLLRIFPDTDHPQYGHGALVILQIPVVFDEDEVFHVVNQLNLAEAKGHTLSNLLGAWCLDPTNDKRNTIAFNAFLPSVLAEPGVLENQVIFQAARSRLYGETQFLA